MPSAKHHDLHDSPSGKATAHILVFDSGVGGLSIVSHLREQLPQAAISYLADNEHFPYGTLQPQHLTERVEALLCQLSEDIKPDLIVLACNTASTLALPTLRSSLKVPVVGVVPAIKPAAQLTQSKVIGLIATPGTISRDYTDELIKEFASELTIIRLGTTELVELVEDRLAVAKLAVPPGQSATASDELTRRCCRIIQPLQDHPQAAHMDTVVLACTHFPLIQQQLAAALPQVKYWIDSGEAIARRVVNLLGDNIHGNASAAGSAYLTKPGAASERLAEQYRHYGFNTLRSYSIRQ